MHTRGSNINQQPTTNIIKEMHPSATASNFSYRGVKLTDMAVNYPIVLRRLLVRNQRTNTF